MEDKKLARVSMNMSHDLKEWYVNKANNLGIAFTALMVMALNEYKKQEEGIASLADAVKLVESQQQK